MNKLAVFGIVFLITSSVFASVTPAFASQNTLVIYTKGTFDESTPFAGLPIKTLINKDTATAEITIDDVTGPLDTETVQRIEKTIKKAKFFDIKTENYPPISGSADYFTYSLEISQGMFQKTITWTDTSENIPVKLNSIRDLILEIYAAFDYQQAPEPTVTVIARDFVINSPTFVFDGMPDTLTIGEVTVLESFPEQYMISAQFDSAHGGFGNREGQALTQAITPHIMELIISEGVVISAITDGIWDELNHQYILKKPN
jgi:hypothetical protein